MKLFARKKAEINDGFFFFNGLQADIDLCLANCRTQVLERWGSRSHRASASQARLARASSETSGQEQQHVSNVVAMAWPEMVPLATGSKLARKWLLGKEIEGDGYE